MSCNPDSAPSHRYQTRSKTRNAALVAQSLVPTTIATRSTSRQTRSTQNPVIAPAARPARKRVSQKGVKNPKTLSSEVPDNFKLPASRSKQPIPKHSGRMHRSSKSMPAKPREVQALGTRVSAIPWPSGGVFNGVYVSTEDWANTLYAGLVSGSDIDRFLRKRSSGYRMDRKHKGRWSNMPVSPSFESEIHRPVLFILETILDSLGDLTNARIPIYTPVTGQNSEDPMPHPDISIVASGPSFEVPLDADSFYPGIGYSNLASFVQLSLDEDALTMAEQAAQAQAFCSKIFVQQPNRDFCRSLVVTETSACLVHCDRSGVYMTPFLSIHDHPRAFVRLVVGICASDEKALGLDTSVYWEIDGTTGRKTSGTVEFERSDGNTVKYSLDVDEPFTRTDILVGRGTTCWNVHDPETGEALIVKDAWRPDAWTSETEFLVAVQGLNGVVQMKSFQDFLAETNGYRPGDFAMDGHRNRVKSRIVMERYDVSIWFFETRHEFVSALRDALTAHRDLLELEILHRDVSLANIFFKDGGPGKGRRGVLLDLDLARWIREDVDLAPASPAIGTRYYQSVSVLSSENTGNTVAAPHDYLDDLESLFYTLCHVVYSFRGPGSLVDGTPYIIDDWNSPKPRSSALAKMNIFVKPIRQRFMPAFWGPAVFRLVTGFHALLEPIVTRKEEIRYSEDDAEAQLAELKRLREEHRAIYHELDKLFAVALEEIDVEDAKSKVTATSLSEDSSALRSALPSNSPVVGREDGKKRSVSSVEASESEASRKRRRLTSGEGVL